MKILYYGNVVNYAFNFTVSLRGAGYTQYCALIEDDDLYTPDYLSADSFDNFHYVYLEKKNNTIEDLQGRSYDLKAFICSFDLVHCFSATAAIYCRKAGVSYIYHNVGCFSDLYRWYDPQRKWLGLASLKDWRLTYEFRRMLSSSRAVIGSLGCDLVEMDGFISAARKASYTLPIPYLAFSSSTNLGGVDVDLFNKKTFYLFRIPDSGTGHKIIVMPARHNWPLKGQPMMYDALLEISRSYEKVTIVCIDWGPHVQQSKEYIESLGLTDSVIWIPRLSPSELQRCLAHASCCLIEFRHGIAGGYGGCVMDALLAGCPVVTQACPVDAVRVFQQPAPVFHADHEGSSIVNALESALSMTIDARVAYARDSKKWLEVECGTELLGKYIAMHEEVLND